MKIAVVVPVALVLGLGLGTAAGRMLHPPEVPAAEGDSAGAEAKDSLKPEAAPPAAEKPAEEHAADSGAAAMTPVPLDATPAPVTPPPAPVVPAGAKAPPAGADVQRMAKIFDRLAAADAAALVAQMSDAELEGVLRTMDVAKAGDLIGALPKARGAALSKRLLAPPAKP
ncbi:MAG: hypothetical protein KA267_06350 [Gemmatimonadales bacterium]|jgi:hypothetical protein|nr:hypothetical protein [Gemmatimonadales bacterium]MBP6571279.1 hypothetical protein [Gemmatimonadales bacterium]MBP7621261.1 hypothetical protein [Gemmatimonadales bacterium]